MLILTLNKDRIKNTLKLYLAFAIVGIVAFAASSFNDVSLCPMYGLTGMPSPGCGMTRAFMSLPDVKLALFYHPLFFVVPFIPLAALLSERARNILSVILIVLFLGTWVVRIYLFFPDIPPMEYNENSLISNLFYWIRNG